MTLRDYYGGISNNDDPPLLEHPLHVSTIYLSLAAFHLHVFPDVGMSYFDIALRDLV